MADNSRRDSTSGAAPADVATFGLSDDNSSGESLSPRSMRRLSLASLSLTDQQQQASPLASRAAAAPSSRASNQQHNQLASAKSLEGERKSSDSRGFGSGAGTSGRGTSQTPETATQRQAASDKQQRQMFSLKQLAINSRNLTRKRSSVQSANASSPAVGLPSAAQPTAATTATATVASGRPPATSGSRPIASPAPRAGRSAAESSPLAAGDATSTRGAGAPDRPFELSGGTSDPQQYRNHNSTSSSGSSVANSCASEGRPKGQRVSSLTGSGAQPKLPGSRLANPPVAAALADGDAGQEESGASDDSSDDSSGDSNDSEYDGDCMYSDSCQHELDASGGEEASDGKTSPGGHTSKRARKGRSRRGGVRRHSSFGRRMSCCNCEPLTNKLDSDGLPVTDVDSVTYKDLCQMEQHAHHMRTNHRKQHLEVFSYSQGSSGLRRSSLQEESGAYYELCTSNEERATRKKYVWYPPALRQLALVDEFFANFPKDKTPLAPAPTATGGSSAPELGVGAKQSSTRQQPAAAASSLAGSYRDEQISFQLPRQDISLDYCSYSMSDSSRATYLQFVDKRNSQALDVGTAIQIRLHPKQPPFGRAAGPRHARQSLTHAAGSVQASGSQTPTCRSALAQQQRKASTVSQATVALLAASHRSCQQDQLLARMGAASAGGALRCRRCLVRFDDGQLAVMAPNFIIGSSSSSLFRPATGGQPPAGRRMSSSSIGGQQVRQQSQQHDAAQSSLLLAAAASGDVQTPTNVALFHPTCFTCSTCKEFLVDLVYCLRDCKLYCLRHYGESLRPRCNWCQELIFSDEYLRAMNESFHVDHFLCRHCDANLAGQRYVLREEKPYCIQCYEANFANACEDCGRPIGVDSRDLSYKERHWHDTCFQCHKCQQSLIDKPFGSKADKVYCADCYDGAFAAKCDGCQHPFRAGSKKMEYRGRQWHDGCFCCAVCREAIGSSSFIPKDEQIYCIKCYEDKFATRCTKCKQVIASGGVTFRNEPWHRECFSCCNCAKSLAGQRFTTRDGQPSESSANKTNQPHNAYCIDCYGELFAKKCHACTKAITGLGGTRFVTFEDRSWHNDCFICHDCRTSLLGKGFITDGPETILCSECARAKLN